MENLQIFDGVDELISGLANDICTTAREAIAKRGIFTFVLSGGNSPKKLYDLLASAAYKDKIDWKKTYFFFGDERFVPEDNAQRNSLMAKKVLFQPLGIESFQIFEVDTNSSPETAAKDYNISLKNHFGDKPTVFDFVLLGLGDNAHTASLFPNNSVLNDKEATVQSIFVKELDMYRITMTAALINQARNIAFLVFGSGKAEATYHVLKDETGSAMQYPARLIREDASWYLDKAAAALL